MRSFSKQATWLLAVFLLMVLMLAGMAIGAVRIGPLALCSILGHAIGISTDGGFTEMQEAVLLVIRMPRVLMAALVGASLASAGAAMQGLFRNPLADPGLIGISSGASLTAVAAIVLGIHFAGQLNVSVLSGITFSGALLTAFIVYRISRLNGKTVVSTLLLAGVSINALAGAATGVFTYAANDAQLRSITFWMLGSLGGATWPQVWGILPFTILPVCLFPRLAKSLNALALDEHNAQYLGVPVERTKHTILFLSACCVGASVSVTGVIGFVGLVIPHMLRLTTGPDHRRLMVLVPLWGASLLVGTDLIARTVFSPSELPIGVITALVGAPVLLYITVKDVRSQKMF